MVAMIFGHLPAGYLASKLLFKRLAPPFAFYPAFMCAGLLGAITPDVDLLWFYHVDGRRQHHHLYFTHWPVVWLSLLALSVWWFRRAERREVPALAIIYSVNGCIHMCLDTIVGDIWWFAPVLDRSFSLFAVPALYKPWWLNYLFHWSMLLEIAVIAFAFWHWNSTRPRKFLQPR